MTAAATIEEIIVTAQKRAQSVQDVPIAITSLTGEEIDALLRGEKPDRPDPSEDEEGPGSAVPVIGKKRKPKAEGGEDFGGEPKPA